MPVEKFRTVQEMKAPRWLAAGSPDLLRALASIWKFGRRLSPPTFKPGVRKFRSLDEMQALT